MVPRRSGGGGIVYLIGAGPGDPRLLTVRGQELLEKAEVVVYDHLASSRLLKLVPPEAIRIPAGKSIGHKTFSQEQINTILADHAQLGRRVVRLKGGDPYVFGRGGEEAEHLYDLGIPFEVVPGVTSGLGATAAAGIAVTHRDSASAVALVTGHDDPNNQGRLDWQALASFPGTLVIYMGVTRLRQLCQTLIAGGKAPETPAAMVQAGTLASQRSISGTLADLPERVAAAGISFPALLVVGEVVARRTRLNWFEKLPLFGQRIVVTRPDEIDGASSRALEELGAEVLLAPTVEIRPVADSGPLDAVIEEVNSFDWIVFTSAHGVRHFLNRLLERGGDLRRLGNSRLAAIGPATAAALLQYHLHADFVPNEFHSEGLAEALGEQVKGQKVLLPRANRGRSHLPDQLRSIAQVIQVSVYDNVDAPSIPPEVLERIEAGTVDWVTLTSSAIAERFYGLLSPIARITVQDSIRLASISPLTSQMVTKLGWNVAVEAAEATWLGLVAAIQTATSTRNSID